MISKKKLVFPAAIVALLLVAVAVVTVAAQGPTPIEQLGEFLYFDENLSTPAGQSCASCHDPDFGFVDPDSDLPVSQGVLPKNRFGNRNSPSSAYALASPSFHFDGELWIGGQFWDGRATGDVLGDPLADQALGPFLNLLEMNNPSKLVVVQKVRRSDYEGLFEEVWGEGSLDDVEEAYKQIAWAIAAFERTDLFAKFNSKFDDYPDDLTEEEAWGLQLFNGKAQCSACHISDGEDPLFTDFSYDNLGVPKNPENPFYYLPKAFNRDGRDFVDIGLGGALKAAGYDPLTYNAEMGKVKVMTLRNIDLTGPYMHNGYFKTIEGVVHFYNTRDTKPECAGLYTAEQAMAEGCWPAPEVAENVNVDELGDLGLTPEEEAAIVAFMRTLTDNYVSGD